MVNPLVSIIVSCYNGEKFIAQTLASLLNQEYFNLEIIVVNDGSTDNSEVIIQSIGDSRIKYFKKDNGGQCAALNFGFRQSSGSLIKFYDADDILHPSVIKGQVEVLQNCNSNNWISFIEWRRFSKDSHLEVIDAQNYHTIHRDCSPIEYITFFDKPPMYQCGLWLIPRHVIIQSGLWDERLSLINDTEFFSRLLMNVTELKFSNKGYTFYRSDPSNISLSKDFSRKGIRSAILSIDLSAQWLIRIENSDRVNKVIVMSYVMILEWAFPKQMLLSKIIERRLKKFPSKFIRHTPSGKLYNIIMKWLGWKVARQLLFTYRKLRYN